MVRKQKQFNWMAPLVCGVLILLGCENKLRTHLDTQKKQTQHLSRHQYLKQAAAILTHPQPFAKLLHHYEALRMALATDDFESIPRLSKKLADTAAVFADSYQESASLNQLQSAANHLKTQKKEKAIRVSFGEVSRYLITIYENSGSKGMSRFRCPMAENFSDWLQPESLSSISNPYMGKRMIHCGFPVSKS